jgi:hypothetical protein
LLERKAAAGLSFSLVDHLRWGLRAIFRLAAEDRFMASNPAEMLLIPPAVSASSRRILNPSTADSLPF